MSSHQAPYEVWFDMRPPTGDSRMAQCPDFFSALAVYDALCAKFVCVRLYGADGAILRIYDNVLEPGTGI